MTLCLSQAAFAKYAAMSGPGSKVYFDSGLVEPVPVSGVQLLGAPFTQIASEHLGTAVVANIVALGVLAADTELIGKHALLAALAQRVPARLLEVNTQALELGFSTPAEVF